ncbi:hypothetical protein IAS59_001076 [Cryptococcus gattii]
MALPNLRSIFASSRTSEEERQLSRTTFYKFTAFVGACLVISLLAAQKGINPSKKKDYGPSVALIIRNCFLKTFFGTTCTNWRPLFLKDPEVWSVLDNLYAMSYLHQGPYIQLPFSFPFFCR